MTMRPFLDKTPKHQRHLQGITLDIISLFLHLSTLKLPAWVCNPDRERLTNTPIYET